MVEVKRLVDGKLSVCFDRNGSSREIAILSADYSRLAEYELRSAFSVLENVVDSAWSEALQRSKAEDAENEDEDDAMTVMPI
jgi:hypothetical protein